MISIFGRGDTSTDLLLMSRDSKRLFEPLTGGRKAGKSLDVEAMRYEKILWHLSNTAGIWASRYVDYDRFCIAGTFVWVYCLVAEKHNVKLLKVQNRLAVWILSN